MRASPASRRCQRKTSIACVERRRSAAPISSGARTLGRRERGGPRTGRQVVHRDAPAAVDGATSSRRTRGPVRVARRDARGRRDRRAARRRGAAGAGRARRGARAIVGSRSIATSSARAREALAALRRMRAAAAGNPAVRSSGGRPRLGWLTMAESSVRTAPPSGAHSAAATDRSAMARHDRRAGDPATRRPARRRRRAPARAAARAPAVRSLRAPRSTPRRRPGRADRPSSGRSGLRRSAVALAAVAICSVGAGLLDGPPSLTGRGRSASAASLGGDAPCRGRSAVAARAGRRRRSLSASSASGCTPGRGRRPRPGRLPRRGFGPLVPVQAPRRGRPSSAAAVTQPTADGPAVPPPDRGGPPRRRRPRRRVVGRATHPPTAPAPVVPALHRHLVDRRDAGRTAGRLPRRLRQPGPPGRRPTSTWSGRTRTTASAASAGRCTSGSSRMPGPRRPTGEGHHLAGQPRLGRVPPRDGVPAGRRARHPAPVRHPAFPDYDGDGEDRVVFVRRLAEAGSRLGNPSSAGGVGRSSRPPRTGARQWRFECSGRSQRPFFSSA